VAQWQCWVEIGRSHRSMGQRALTCLAQGGWTVGPPVSGGLFDFFRCRKKKCWCCCWTTVTERFLTAEGGSSADEVDDVCLSVVGEVQGLAVAEATGPRESERPAGAAAPGSKVVTEPPGPRARRKKNKGKSQHGTGRLERRRRQALCRQ
jgi:hypothetical protein